VLLAADSVQSNQIAASQKPTPLKIQSIKIEPA